MSGVIGIRDIPPRNGLMLYYDYGNPRCYPGTGTDVFDLSVNGNHGEIMLNGLISTDFGGVFRMPGVDDKITTPYHATLHPTTGMTVVFFVKSPFTNVNVGGVGVLGGGGNRGWALGNSLTDAARFYVAETVSTLRNSGVATFDVSDRWVMMSGRYDPSNYIDYGVNAVQVSVNTTSAPANTIDNGNDFQVGERGQNAGEIDGDIGPTLIYNRPITDSELTRIFNIFKHRFGI